MADEPRVDQTMRREQATGSDVGEASPLGAEVARALEGAVFPLERERLVWVARENDAPGEVLTALERLPRGPFASLERVVAQVGPGAPEAPAGP